MSKIRAFNGACGFKSHPRLQVLRAAHLSWANEMSEGLRLWVPRGPCGTLRINKAGPCLRADTQIELPGAPGGDSAPGDLHATGAECLSQLGDQAARGQRKHQARDSAEEHADPHKRADDPFRARWPRPPNHDSKDQGDDSVE